MLYEQFSAYTLEPEEGWHAVHRLPLESAIHYLKDFRSRTAGSLVALVPDGADPIPYLDLVTDGHYSRKMVNRHLRVVA